MSNNKIKILVNGIDVTYCEHFRFRNHKEFSCKKENHECDCNPHATECKMYIKQLIAANTKLSNKLLRLQILLEEENCNFDKIKDLIND